MFSEDSAMINSSRLLVVSFVQVIVIVTFLTHLLNQSSEVGTIIDFVLQMRKLRHKKIKWLVYGCTAKKGGHRESSPSIPTSEPSVLPALQVFCFLFFSWKCIKRVRKLDSGFN